MAATKKAAAKKTAAKKAAPKGTVKVKMITTVDTAPGKDTTVFFADGTRAVVKRDSNLSNILTNPENVAPNIIKVTMQKDTIVAVKPVEVDRDDD